MPKTIGSILKNIRLAKGYSLRHMAARADCSASFLSQIEQGQTSPSLGNFARICEALDMSVTEVWDMIENRRQVVLIPREHKGEVAHRWESASLHYVLPPSQQSNQSYLMLELKPHGETLLRSATRTMKELCVVLSGKVQVFIGDTTEVLRAGDSIYFDLIQPHRWVNLTANDVKVLLINPSFTVVRDLVPMS
jgi:transcriptional regulator with XRE-family HTH domain